MSTSCCGHPCDTKYCPHCGEIVNDIDVSLSSLLAYCQKQAAATKKHYERARECLADSDDVYRRRRLALKERGFKKWESWATALKEAIAASKNRSKKE